MANTFTAPKKMNFDYSRTASFLKRWADGPHDLIAIEVPWRVPNKSIQFSIKRHVPWETFTPYENVVRSFAVLADGQGVFVVDRTVLWVVTSVFVISNLTTLPMPQNKDGEDDATLASELTQYFCVHDDMFNTFFMGVYENGLEAAKSYADTMNQLGAQAIGAALDVNKALQNEDVMNLVEKHLAGDKDGE